MKAKSALFVFTLFSITDFSQKVSPIIFLFLKFQNAVNKIVTIQTYYSLFLKKFNGNNFPQLAVFTAPDLV